MKVCRIEHCGKPVLAKGLCVPHYAKNKKYGDPLADFTRRAKPCAYEGCEKMAHAKGYCHNHYRAVFGRVRSEKERQRKPKPIFEQALFDRINVTDGCWEWIPKPTNTGYGLFQFDKKKKLAHRAVWELVNGPVPEGLELDHLCRNRRCCNPDHLEAVTHQVNVHRGVAPTAVNAAKTHCDWGHEFTPENTIRRPDGRECRECQRANGRVSHLRKRAQRTIGDAVRFSVSRWPEDVPIEPGVYEHEDHRYVVLTLEELERMVAERMARS